MPISIVKLQIILFLIDATLSNAPTEKSFILVGAICVNPQHLRFASVADTAGHR